MPTFNELERRCIRQLAEWYPMQKGGFFSVEALSKLLGITVDDCQPLVTAMRDVGAVENLMDSGGLIHGFYITFAAVQYHREIEAFIAESKAPPDIVEQITNWARRRWIVAGLVVISAALAVLVTIVDGALSILEKLGWIGNN